jgi:mRNA interferase HicA
LREIKRKGWIFLRRGKGSHLIFQKNGKQVVVPDHGSKELGKGLEKKLRKEMQL